MKILFIENLSYNQLSQWQKEVKVPSEHALNSVNITRLTQSITEKNRMDLFRCRAKRVGGNGDNVIKANKYKLNLYYNPLKRGEKICDIQHSVAEQSTEVDRMIATKEPVTRRRGRPANPKVENQEL